jgi:four helix bundle protein
MKVKRFEDLIAWQKAIDFSNNIAEGFDRGTDADLKRFPNISRSSCNEVKSMLYLAERLHYISSADKNIVLEKCTEVSKIVYGLHQSLNK